ncbi:MAG: hypothetical protein FJW37_10205 [Acidobacteria bacterium]|nr:hypothetical protein [Acidobacteriota bacterium]
MRILIFALVLVAALAVAAPAQKPQPAGLLCIWPTLNSDLLEEAAVDRLQALRGSGGLSKSALPILQYSMDNDAERAYCEQQLKVRRDQAFMLGVASWREVSGAIGADKVLYRVDNVTDYVTACTNVFARAMAAKRAGPNVALVIVCTRAHPPREGADAIVQRIRHDESLLRDLATRATAQTQAAGFGPQQVKCIGLPATDAGDIVRRLGIDESSLPFVGIVGLSASDAPQNVIFRLSGVSGMSLDEAASQISRKWADALAWLKQPQPRNAALRGPNGQYVKVDGSKVVCKSNEAVTLTLIDLDGDVLRSGDKVAVMAGKTYFSAEEGGGKMLVSNANDRAANETFVIQKTGPDGNPEIRSGNQVVFRGDKGKYWTAENGGGGLVNNKGDAPSVWEVFILELR